MSYRPTCSTKQGAGQQGLHRETLSGNKSCLPVTTQAMVDAFQMLPFMSVMRRPLISGSAGCRGRSSTLCAERKRDGGGLPATRKREPVKAVYHV